MAAIVKNLSLEQGVTYTFGFTMRQKDTNLPIDLTGCTAKLHVRLSDSEPAPLIELSTSNGRIVLGGVAGTLNLTFEPADTASHTFRSGVYDLFLYWPSGQTWRLFKGAATLERVVTHA